MYTKVYHDTRVKILDTQISVFHILQRNVSILHCRRIRQKGSNSDINSNTREFVEAAYSFVLHIHVNIHTETVGLLDIYIYIYIYRERERERDRDSHIYVCMAIP